MPTTVYYRFKFRGRTAASWITNEGLGEILLAKEGGYETDTGKLKIGNGVDGWSALPYFDPSLHGIATGTADAITATYASKPILYDGLQVALRASAANTGAVTFAPNGLTARAVTKHGGTALSAGDIAAAGHQLLLCYVAATPRWELLNPAATGGSTYTDADARAAVVINSIADSDTDHAPSRNAVYDALAGKQPLATPLTSLAGLAGSFAVPIGNGAGGYTQVAFTNGTFLGLKSGDLAPTVYAMSSDAFDFVAAANYAAMRAAIGFDAAARAAVIASAITNGDLTHAPDGNSVFDALALKADISYVDGAVTGLLDFKGDTNASANPNYPAALKGDAYYISAAGKIGGASGKSVEIGDVYVAKADNAGGTEAAVGTSWFVMERNLVGAMVGANNLSEITSQATARSNIGAAGLTVFNAWSDEQRWTLASGTKRLWITSAGGGQTSVGQTHGGLLISSTGMNTSNKYGDGLLFGSDDVDFTGVTGEKFLAGIIPYATENYVADTDGGMGLSFWGSPIDPGSSPSPTHLGDLSVEGGCGLRINDVGGYFAGTTVEDALQELGDVVVGGSNAISVGLASQLSNLTYTL